MSAKVYIFMHKERLFALGVFVPDTDRFFWEKTINDMTSKNKLGTVRQYERSLKVDFRLAFVYNSYITSDFPGGVCVKFTKWQGIGNDFVIVNGFEEKIADYASKAIAVCDRHFGIGADGLVFALPSDIADFRMRIFNSDGSEAEMCGNVTRCFARYVYEAGLTNKTELAIETLAGIIRPKLLFENGKVSAVRVDMGEPKLKRGLIPMTGGSGSASDQRTADGGG